MHLRTLDISDVVVVQQLFFHPIFQIILTIFLCFVSHLDFNLQLISALLSGISGDILESNQSYHRMLTLQTSFSKFLDNIHNLLISSETSLLWNLLALIKSQQNIMNTVKHSRSCDLQGQIKCHCSVTSIETWVVSHQTEQIFFQTFVNSG